MTAQEVYQNCVSKTLKSKDTFFLTDIQNFCVYFGEPRVAGSWFNTQHQDFCQNPVTS